MNNKKINRRTKLNSKNIDVDYCFLSDVGCGEFSKTSFSTDKIRKKYLNNLTYKDPDNSSKLLYNYHAFLWEFLDANNDKHCACRKKYGWNEITYTSYEQVYYLASDYVGASTYWAKYKNISDDILNDYLSVSRSIGGHIPFWRHSEDPYECWYQIDNEYILVSKEENRPSIDHKKLTINTARGGSKGVFDRFDWTLVLLKVYYENISKNFDDRQSLFMSSKIVIELLNYKNLSEDELKLKYNSSHAVLRMFYSFENSRNWLLTFNAFIDFISFFQLESFIKEDGSVIEIVPLFPVFPDDYNAYINNSKSQIIKRINQIKEKLSNM